MFIVVIVSAALNSVLTADDLACSYDPSKSRDISGNQNQPKVEIEGYLYCIGPRGGSSLRN